jgi:hypothetical protein
MIDFHQFLSSDIPVVVGPVLWGALSLVIVIWLLRLIFELVKTAVLITVGLLVAGVLAWMLATAFQFDVLEHVRPYFESNVALVARGSS